MKPHGLEINREIVGREKYKKTKKQFVDNYKTSANIAISFLWLSHEMMTTYGDGDDGAGAIRFCGYLILPVAVILTPFSAVAGTLCAVGNTVWGAGALPIAAIKDSQKENNTARSSTRMMQETLSAMPAYGDIRCPHQYAHIPRSPFVRPDFSGPDLERTIALSLQDPHNSNQNYPQNPVIHEEKRNLSIYSTHTREYIKNLEKNECFEEKIQALQDSLETAGDALTQSEIVELEQFKDPITFIYMKIPVFLNDKFYNLDTLDKIKTDPYTREEFNPREIQSARVLLEKFDEILEKIKLNHPTPCHKSSLHC